MLRSKFNGRDIYLIETVEELSKLRQAVVKCGTLGLDCETTGLDFNKDRAVGVCISFSDKKGFYVPYRHSDYENNLPKDKVIEMCQYILDNKIVMFFNRNYDLNMLEFDGVKIPYNGRFHDVQVMCWEATNEPFPSLKKYTKMYLKWDMIEFETAAGTDEDGNSNHNFGLVDPREGYRYAAGDPLATVALGKYMWNNYPYIRKIYPLDNLATEAVRRMGQEVVSIDYNLLKQLADESERELRDLRYQIIKFVGYEFNIGSNREKGRALSRFVTLTVKTKNGDFSMRDEIISEIDHPLAQLMVKYSKAFKFNNSFIKPLLKLEGTPIRFNFKTVDVPTGRMACLAGDTKVRVIRSWSASHEEDIQLKEVYANDRIKTRFGYFRVVNVFKQRKQVYLLKTEKSSIKATSDHLFYQGSGYWSEVESLKEGDFLMWHTGKESLCREKILAKEALGVEDVYDIQVDSVHEFLCAGDNACLINGGYVTHNCGKVNGNPWFAPLNVQALPKKKVHRFLHEGGDMGYYLDDNPEGAVLDENGKPIDQEVKAGFRDIFTVPSDEWAFISSDYCLSNQSMVRVKGFGEVPLYFVERLLKFYKMQVYIETPNGWEKVIRFVNTEKKPKVQVTLKTGEVITCSEDHSFKVLNSAGVQAWRQVKELKSDDVILTKDLLKV